MQKEFHKVDADQAAEAAGIAKELNQAIALGSDCVEGIRFKLRIALSRLFAPLCSPEGDLDVTAENVLGAYRDCKSLILSDGCLEATEAALDFETMGVAGADFGFLGSYGWGQAHIDLFVQDVLRENEGNYGIIANMPLCLEENLAACKKLGMELDALARLDAYCWGFLLVFCDVERLAPAFRKAGFSDVDTLEVLMGEDTGLFDKPASCVGRIEAIRDPEAAASYFRGMGFVDEVFFGC
ncbi:MAG: hypothetical protein ACI4B9_00635 [Eggerthellaceae bacterium]